MQKSSQKEMTQRLGVKNLRVKKEGLMKYVAFMVLGLSVLLTACGTPALPPGFSLDAVGSISVEQGDKDSLTIDVTRTGGFADALTFAFSNAPTGVNLGFSEIQTTAAVVSLSVDVADSVSEGNYPMSIEASSAGMTKSIAITLVVSAPAVKINSALIETYEGSTQVSQGSELIFEVLGKGLEGIALAKLGDVTGTVLTNNNVSARIKFEIPHDESMGSKSLLLAANAGQVSLENAAIITAITASPTGNNITGLGTPDKPYRSLSMAAMKAMGGLGATIKLKDGTYSEANFEIYPLTLMTLLSIEGESKNGTIFEGNGVDNCFEVLEGSRISNMTLTNCDVAITVNPVPVGLGPAIISDVALNANLKGGLLVKGAAAAEAKGLMVDSNGSAGIGLMDDAELSLNTSIISKNPIGLFASNTSKASIKGSTFSQNPMGIKTEDTAQLKIENSSILKATSIGLYVESAGATIVEGTSINQNNIGVAHVTTNGSLNMRQSIVSDNTTFGVGIGAAPASIDLGTAANPGNNTFNDNGSFQLYDARPALAAPNGVIISAIGNTLSGLVPTTGIKTGVAEQINGLDNVWRINKANHRIEF